jgi:hypothetical protein
MSDVAVFSYPYWSAAYPELAASVAQPQAQGYWDQATLYCDNSPQSLIRDLTQRAVLLGMVTAHIAALRAPLNGQPSSPLVGRISNATQGSVNVTTQFDQPAGSAQWFAQTKYGAAYWQATVQYRTMRYVPGPQPFRRGPVGVFGNPWGL